MLEIIVNDVTHQLDVEPDTPLLWVVRDELKLKGTKFGCGMAQCGACTVHLDGVPIRSCVTPISAVTGRAITTIEGINNEADTLHVIQQAWIEEQVPQCGYCQSGQIMSAVALLEKTPQPNDDDINNAMKGNVCRCGMYGRIRKAIKTASAKLPNEIRLTPIEGSTVSAGSVNSTTAEGSVNSTTAEGSVNSTAAEGSVNPKAAEGSYHG